MLWFIYRLFAANSSKNEMSTALLRPPHYHNPNTSNEKLKLNNTKLKHLQLHYHAENKIFDVIVCYIHEGCIYLIKIQ